MVVPQRKSAGASTACHTPAAPEAGRQNARDTKRKHVSYDGRHVLPGGVAVGMAVGMA
jgi:hypothetical protein